MQNLLACFVAAMAAFQTPSLVPGVTRSQSVLVRAVIDGDTIDVATIGRVRLLGIDAPEIGRGFDTGAPFAREAHERLASLVLRHWVRLEQESTALDAYDRHLAYVMREDGLFVNAALVRDGLARVVARTPLVRLDELKRAEAEAQLSRRGMWGATPPLPPGSYTPRLRGRRATSPKSGTPLPRRSRRQTNKKKTRG